MSTLENMALGSLLEAQKVAPALAFDDEEPGTKPGAFKVSTKILKMMGKEANINTGNVLFKRVRDVVAEIPYNDLPKYLGKKEMSDAQDFIAGRPRKAFNKWLELLTRNNAKLGKYVREVPDNASLLFYLFSVRISGQELTDILFKRYFTTDPEHPEELKAKFAKKRAQTESMTLDGLERMVTDVGAFARAGGTQAHDDRPDIAFGAANIEDDLRREAMAAMGEPALMTEGRRGQSTAFLGEANWGASRKELVKILTTGPAAEKSLADKLAKRFADEFGYEITAEKSKFGYDIRWVPEGKKGPQTLYQVGPNNIVWEVWQGQREKPYGFADELLKRPIDLDDDHYPSFQGMPKEDAWVMAQRIDPKNPALPKGMRESAPPDVLSWLMGRDLQGDIARNNETGYVPAAGVLGNRERGRQQQEIEALGRKTFGYEFTSEYNGVTDLWVSHRSASRSTGEYGQKMRELGKVLLKSGYRVKTIAAKGNAALIDTMYVLYNQDRIKAAERGQPKYLDAMRKGGAAKMNESVDRILGEALSRMGRQVAPTEAELLEGVQACAREGLERLVEASNGKVETFLLLLVGHLTQYDQQETMREMKRGGRGNIYRLGLLFQAVDKVRADVARVLHSDDAASLEALKASLGSHFHASSFRPVVKLVKQIDEFLTKGKLPKYPVTAETRAQVKAEKAAKAAAKKGGAARAAEDKDLLTTIAESSFVKRAV